MSKVITETPVAPTPMTIVSGIQPSGSMHLGNYFGAIRPWVDLQYRAKNVFFFIADLHSLTNVVPAEQRQRSIQDLILMLVACGVDPEKANIFRQSSILYHTELAWHLMCIARTGWLNRMVQYKDKMGTETSVSAGLYTYPVLQAADILLYDATHVPVGEDQFQHLQLTRDIAQSFNSTYGETLVVPEPLVTSVGGRIMSLFDGKKKMSKSDASADYRIDLLDDPDTVARKIKRATTDSAMLPETVEELANRPEALNLVTILAGATQRTPQEVLNEMAGMGFGKLKPAITEALNEMLAPIQRRFYLFSDNREDRIEHFLGNSDNAFYAAEETMVRVRERIGDA